MGAPVDPVAESSVPSGTSIGISVAVPSEPLTRKVQAYNWIRTYIETTGHSPSMGDVAGGLGVSLSRAKALVHQLTREKRIDRSPGAQRGISIPGLFEQMVLKKLRERGFVVDSDITGRPCPQEHLQLVALLEHLPVTVAGESHVRSIDNEAA
jgi:SOS-response transcriptional repressor LexA